MIRRASVLVAFVALACAAAPGAARMPTVAPGVRAGAVPLAGLTSEPARAKLEASFSRSIPVELGSHRWWASTVRLGAGAAIDAAVSHALDARDGQRVPVNVHWSAKSVRQFVDAVAKSVEREPIDAEVIHVGRAGPLIREAQPGLAVRRYVLRRELELELEHGTRVPIVLPTRSVPAARTRAKFGPIIWIDRSANTLRFYATRKLVRTFRVATGRSQYPTPTGLWSVVDLQRNPWWRPPDSAWAKGLKPIPPGPGNPLGTRWMGLSAAGVGIRMHIPDAEWLFQHVALGTPVYIT